MVHYNPHQTGFVLSPIYTKQPGALFFIAQLNIPYMDPMGISLSVTCPLISGTIFKRILNLPIVNFQGQAVGFQEG